MRRTALIAMGAVGVALLGATQASADAPPPGGGTAVTCGTYGLQSGLSTKVCAEKQGNFVQLYGQISLAGPPSPGSPLSTKQLDATLTGEAGGYSLGSVQQHVAFTSQTVQVRGVSAVVPCGSTVHATFTVSSYPWTPVPVTLDLPTTC